MKCPKVFINGCSRSVFWYTPFNGNTKDATLADLISVHKFSSPVRANANTPQLCYKNHGSPFDTFISFKEGKVIGYD